MPDKMTFADLKSELEKLTPEQLACEVVWSGDERGGKVTALWIAAEDWVESDGDCEPISVVPEVDRGRVLIPVGTPHLLVD